MLRSKRAKGAEGCATTEEVSSPLGLDIMVGTTPGASSSSGTSNVAVFGTSNVASSPVGSALADGDTTSAASSPLGADYLISAHDAPICRVVTSIEIV